jgi:DNA-nicking Smr family endonuclease
MYGGFYVITSIELRKVVFFQMNEKIRYLERKVIGLFNSTVIQGKKLIKHTINLFRMTRSHCHTHLQSFVTQKAVFSNLIFHYLHLPLN